MSKTNKKATKKFDIKVEEQFEEIKEESETVIKKEKVVNKWKCYTFINNVSIGNDIYWIGERVMLDSSDLKVYWKYVVLTSEYKWKPFNKPSKKWCGC